jgi:hypothetical protein
MRILPASASAAPNDTASAFIEQASWLVRTNGVVTDLRRVDDHTVRVLVADPFVRDPEDRKDADHLAADSAVSVLEQAAHGVRLIPTTSDGYEGHARELTPAQLTFLTGLPGVQRYDLFPEDLDGDGAIAPEEVAHHVEVDTPRDVEHLDWLLRDRIDAGSTMRGPDRIDVPAQPWTLAPVSGT